MRSGFEKRVLQQIEKCNKFFIGAACTFSFCHCCQCRTDTGSGALPEIFRESGNAEWKVCKGLGVSLTACDKQNLLDLALLQSLLEPGTLPPLVGDAIRARGVQNIYLVVQSLLV